MGDCYNILSSKHLFSSFHVNQGPVNRVYWNNFATELFLSCSADWSVRLWNQEITTPLQIFKGAQVS